MEKEIHVGNAALWLVEVKSSSLLSLAREAKFKATLPMHSTLGDFSVFSYFLVPWLGRSQVWGHFVNLGGLLYVFFNLYSLFYILYFWYLSSRPSCQYTPGRVLSFLCLLFCTNIHLSRFAQFFILAPKSVINFTLNQCSSVAGCNLQLGANKIKDPYFLSSRPDMQQNWKITFFWSLEIRSSQIISTIPNTNSREIEEAKRQI